MKKILKSKIILFAVTIGLIIPLPVWAFKKKINYIFLNRLYKIKDLLLENIEGKWTAKIIGTDVEIEFNNKERSSSSSSFTKSDLNGLKNTSLETITLVRDAGRLMLTGEYTGNVASGSFKFIPSESYLQKMKSEGIEKISERNVFTFFLINIKSDYVQSLAKAGCNLTSNADVITFSALKINPDYINLLKSFGYEHLKTHEIISAKASGIDSIFLTKMRNANKENLPIYQLISLKSKASQN